MKAVKTYRYRVKSKSACRRLSAAARAVNVVWNHCNAAYQHAIKHNQSWPSIVTLQASVRGSSKLLGIPAQTVQEVCEQYGQSRRQARKAKLRWRGKRSLGWVPFKNQTITLIGSVVYLKGSRGAETQRIPLWLHRAIVGTVKSGSFSADARGRWYCNLVVEAKPDIEGAKALTVGVDLGLKTLATLSTGEKIQHPLAFRNLEKRLGAAQRANKTRLMRTIYAKITNTRRDFLHKETTKLADRFDCIMVGNASASWQQQFNGKSATDASWGMFRKMLRYKAIARSAQYVDVPEAWTTQVCSACGALPEGRPKGIAGLEVRHWTCGGCGVHHDRDVNAARNIARLGRQALVEGAQHLGIRHDPATRTG